MNRESSVIHMKKGFGSVRYISGGRRNAYAVHPPAVTEMRGGKRVSVRQKAICYVSDWFTGFAVLAAWHAGKYKPGMEREIEASLRCRGEESERPATAEVNDLVRLDEYCDRLQSYVIALEQGKVKTGTMNRAITLQEGFQRFYRYKFGDAAPKKLSKETARLTRNAILKLAPVLDRRMDDLTVDELQTVISSIKCGRSMISRVVTLLKEIYKYAVSRELCDRNPAQYVKMPDTAGYVHHQDFTDEELRLLWENKEDAMVRMVLIMCYSGFRVSAYKTMETNTKEWFFRGGIKTESSKNRVVPVHSGIRPLVSEMLQTEGQYLFGLSIDVFCKRMHRKMVELGIDVDGRHHTPHSCRHTFSRLCESYGVREADRKRMLGHSFGNDMTNGVYGHRTLEELRGEIEKIQLPG